MALTIPGSISASHQEAHIKHGDIKEGPVEAASLAADPSFVLSHSHVNHFDNMLGASANTTGDDIAAMQQSVFNMLLLTHSDFQPAAQP